MMPTSDDVEECDLEDIYELAADARDDGVRPQHRNEERWFRYGDVGMICLWEPGNRSNTKRISHWWVEEESRDEGIGEALLDAAIQAAMESDCDRLDIYVYDPDPIEQRGFEKAEGGHAIDDAEYYEKIISQ